jgi:hypothetical protein
VVYFVVFEHVGPAGAHELFAHAFSIGSYGHDVGDGDDDLVSDKDVRTMSSPEITDKQRGMMVNSVMKEKVNKGPVLVSGRGGAKFPNMNTVVLNRREWKYEVTDIGKFGFDIRKEMKQAMKKQ